MAFQVTSRRAFPGDGFSVRKSLVLAVFTGAPRGKHCRETTAFGRCSPHAEGPGREGPRGGQGLAQHPPAVQKRPPIDASITNHSSVFRKPGRFCWLHGSQAVGRNQTASLLNVLRFPHAHSSADGPSLRQNDQARTAFRLFLENKVTRKRGSRYLDFHPLPKPTSHLPRGLSYAPSCLTPPLGEVLTPALGPTSTGVCPLCCRSLPSGKALQAFQPRLSVFPA